MNNPILALERKRFADTLQIVYKEGRHLLYSQSRLFLSEVDGNWVVGLETHPEEAERLEAFVSRFGRMQDTLGEKLLPRWLMALGEKPASMIDTLNRAERLGVLGDAATWLAVRQMRNSLIHEYLEDVHEFAAQLNMANTHVATLIAVYQGIRDYALTTMGFAMDEIPPGLANMVFSPTSPGRPVPNPA